MNDNTRGTGSPLTAADLDAAVREVQGRRNPLDVLPSDAAMRAIVKGGKAYCSTTTLGMLRQSWGAKAEPYAQTRLPMFVSIRLIIDDDLPDGWLSPEPLRAALARMEDMIAFEADRGVRDRIMYGVAPCTGMTATWCSIHGRCTCSRRAGDGELLFDDPECTLHSVESRHAGG